MKKFLKALYNAIPFKGDIILPIIKLFRPPHNIYQHLHFKGKFHVNGTETTYPFNIYHHGYEIENEVFWRGVKGYEPVSMKLWLKLCYKSKVIFDVGANTGIFTLVAGASLNKPQVYSFEPVSRIYNKMVKNVKANEFNIHPFEYAVSNQNGTAVFYDTDDPHNYSATLNKDFKKGKTIETHVTTITLDKFVRDNNVIPDLVKIDVERYEPEVIEGFVSTLKEHTPTVLIEILDEEIAERIEALIKGLPYKYYSINEHGGIREVDRLAKSDSFNFLICTPGVGRELGL